MVAVTLACSVANIARKPAAQYLAPVLAVRCPEEYRGWINPGINTFCKVLAVLFAWMLATLIYAVQSAIQGGNIAARAMIRLLNKHANLKAPIDESETMLDEAVGWTLAACGVIVQFKMGFRLPFPLNIVLLPLIIMQWFLAFCVTFIH
mmetsp:Transcript_12093/g.26791  ORF Transcript_12093/g.26791 Transcript_12093/m.26791 type:complete len:149 (-) Transcript_12093:102-548(-)